MRLTDVPLSEWERVMSTNLRSTFLVSRAALRLMVPRRSGSIVLVSSAGVLRGFPLAAPYAATKAALETLVRCWADEVEVSNIRAVLVDPGAMRTRLRAEAYPGEEPDSLIDPISIGPLLAEIIGREDLGLPSKVVSFADWASARAAAAHGKP